MLAHDVHGLAQLFGGRRVGVQPRLGEAHAADVDRHLPLGLVRADDELGRAAADVDDEVRAAIGRRRRDRSSRRGTTARPPRHPRAARARCRGSPPRASKKSSRFVASRAALVAVARTASTPPSSSIACRYSRSAASVRSIASGARRRGRVDALAEPGDASSGGRAARAGTARGSSISPTSRRVELVPMSIAASLMPAAPRDRVEALVDPAPDRIGARRRGTRRSARGGTSRPDGSRPRRRTARGPVQPAGSAASRSLRVRGVRGSQRRRDRSPRSPPAPRRRPRAATPTGPARRRPASSASASACRREQRRVADHRRLAVRRSARRRRTRPAAHDRGARSRARRRRQKQTQPERRPDLSSFSARSTAPGAVQRSENVGASRPRGSGRGGRGGRSRGGGRRSRAGHHGPRLLARPDHVEAVAGQPLDLVVAQHPLGLCRELGVLLLEHGEPLLGVAQLAPLVRAPRWSGTRTGTTPRSTPASRSRAAGSRHDSSASRSSRRRRSSSRHSCRRPAPGEGRAAGKRGGFAEAFFDAQQLVVLRRPGPSGRAHRS